MEPGSESATYIHILHFLWVIVFLSNYQGYYLTQKNPQKSQQQHKQALWIFFVKNQKLKPLKKQERKTIQPKYHIVLIIQKIKVQFFEQKIPLKEIVAMYTKLKILSRPFFCAKFLNRSLSLQRSSFKDKCRIPLYQTTICFLFDQYPSYSHEYKAKQYCTIHPSAFTAPAMMSLQSSLQGASSSADTTDCNKNW